MTNYAVQKSLIKDLSHLGKMINTLENELNIKETRKGKDLLIDMLNHKTELKQRLKYVGDLNYELVRR
mgnify:FL=1|tara:strand:+ start:63 stop:266 length:204 start_codon:yes stop_codon:yes gene_type:complete